MACDRTKMTDIQMPQLEDKTVVVIIGETGSGKRTQLLQILESAGVSSTPESSASLNRSASRPSPSTAMPPKHIDTAATTTATYHAPLIPRPTTAAVILIPLPRHDLLLKLPLLLVFLLLLSLSIFFLYPSSPTLTLTHLRLNHISVLTKPSLSLSLSFSLALRVLNPDFFSLWLSTLHVSISYRGHDLGFLDSQPYSTISPRSVSYINATLDLDGAEAIGDVIYLIEDVAKGVIPFDTATNVSGELGIIFFKVPIKGKVSCEVLVNIKNQMITDQNCFPQGLFEESRSLDVR